MENLELVQPEATGAYTDEIGGDIALDTLAKLEIAQDETDIGGEGIVEEIPTVH